MEELVLTGMPIGNGIAIGNLFFLEAFDEQTIPEFSITTNAVENEVERYRRAIFSSREGLYDLQRFLLKEGSSTAVSIVDAHIEILYTPFLTTLVETGIRKWKKNSEAVLSHCVNEYEKKFSRIRDSSAQQRLADVKDVASRVLKSLDTKGVSFQTEIPAHSVVLTKELIPSRAAEFSLQQVSGVVTEFGGVNSHAALIARSKGFPYVTDVQVDLLYPYCGRQVIIDGTQGKVIVDPTDETLQKYRESKKKKGFSQAHGKEKALEKAVTLDGCQATVMANLESAQDLKVLYRYGAEGIGLVRSEFFFLTEPLETISEDKQYALYKEIADASEDLPITFRVFDVGGDKGKVSFYPPEPNPALGCRALRFLLRNQEIFIRQLRALLRLGKGRKINILLPLVSSFEEIQQTKEIMKEVVATLENEGIGVAKSVGFGVMIEVPAMVAMADLLAQEVDFISIGTNDLTQYTLAADRAASQSYAFYSHRHPAMIRMIRQITTAAHMHHTPVSVCGEMASDLCAVPLLLGLGIREFSCSVRFIPRVKNILRLISLSEAESVVDEVLKVATKREVEAILEAHYQTALEKASACVAP